MLLRGPRRSLFRQDDQSTGVLFFLGSSLTQGGPTARLMPLMLLDHFLSALLRLLLKWGFLTALNNRKLKQLLSLKSVISGVKANEALCKRASLPVPYRQR